VASDAQAEQTVAIMVRYMKRLLSVAGAGSDSNAGVVTFERLQSMI
jgi:hypothetical protein